MLVGSALITTASLCYFDFDTLPTFVIEKLPLRFEAIWLLSLRVHVASAALSFPLCILLMTRRLQRRARLHRWLGRVAGSSVLLGLVPSGLVLACAAKGGSAVSAGFMLSAAIVAGCMVQGISSARRRDFLSHRRAMWHVVGQMSVAVASRALLLGLDALGVDPSLSYLLALWGPVLTSAAFVELASRGSASVSPNIVHLIERIRREVSAFALLVRIRAVVRPLTRVGR